MHVNAVLNALRLAKYSQSNSHQDPSTLIRRTCVKDRLSAVSYKTWTFTLFLFLEEHLAFVYNKALPIGQEECSSHTTNKTT